MTDNNPDYHKIGIHCFAWNVIILTIITIWELVSRLFSDESIDGLDILLHSFLFYKSYFFLLILLSTACAYHTAKTKKARA